MPTKHSLRIDFWLNYQFTTDSYCLLGLRSVVWLLLLVAVMDNYSFFNLVVGSGTEEMGDMEEEEEFVLLDLDGVCMPRDIPPNVPYVLSGLDTMNPMLVLGDKLKLIGEYQETIGTCFIFSENDSSQGMHKEMIHSTSDVHNSDKGNDAGGNDVYEKQVKPIARLHKILKFRLFHEDSDQGAEVEAEAYDLEDEGGRPTNPASQIDGSMPAIGTEG